MPRPKSAPPKIVIPATNYFVSETSSPVSRNVLTPIRYPSSAKRSDKFVDRLPNILSSTGEIEIHKTDDDSEIFVNKSIPIQMNGGGDVLVVTDINSEIDE